MLSSIAIVLAHVLVQPGGPKEAEAAYGILQQRVGKIRTLQLKEVVEQAGKTRSIFQYKMARPNLCHESQYIVKSKATFTTYGDGKLNWFLANDNQYTKNPAEPDRVNQAPDGFEQMYSPKECIYEFESCSDERFDGQDVSLINVRYKYEEEPQIGLYISKKSGLPIGHSLSSANRRKPTYFHYTNVVIDEPINPSEFVCNLPKGATLLHIDLTSKLLKIGAAVPLFSVKSVDGQDIDLSKLLMGKRALILSFWFCGCAPCREELHQLQAEHARLKNQGLELLAINTQDSASEIRRFEKEQKLNIPVVADANSKANFQEKFGVMSYPTNYVIGPDGKVVAAFVGYDKTGIAKALKALGIDLD